MIRAVIIALCMLPWAVVAQSVVEPDEYRNHPYRGPVPDSLRGVTVINTDSAFALWKTDHVVFVDVLPRAPKPKNLPEGTIWREKSRYSIPGSIWLPNVGYGKLAEITHDYFKRGLNKATSGNVDHPVVFFCLAECWMSWNAAKRAVEYGFTHVFWFPEGTDGWGFQDYPTQKVAAEKEP
ncbi:MAG: PQQ-dependent catabolism-associated CXXCW motif protein [Hyphomicrobiales bacterium]|nr:PQQ-dependent catabolism-associated CXXCW motif protein [Hyphomicrobiales bacterium]